MSAPFSTIPQMTMKVLTPADGLVEVVEKVQFNFDQILLNGGGPKGDKGDTGDKGLPGATGIGTQGDPGRRGSFIWFTGTTINNGDLVTDPQQILQDVAIDVDGDYFQIEENIGTGDLEYIFKFNINTASLNTYWIDQDSWIASSPQPINEYLRLEDGGLNQNLLVGRRTDNGGGFDKAEFYRLLVGMDTYPFGGSQEIPLVICNVLPNSIDAANDNPFYQVAFKYRESSGSNVGANSVFVKYTEQAASFNRYLFSVDNASTGVFLRHDTNDTDDSEVLVRGRHLQLIGKSTNIDTITEWLDIQIDTDLATFTAQKDILFTPDSPLAGDKVTIQHQLLEMDALVGTPTITTANSKSLIITTDTPGSNQIDMVVESLTLNNDFIELVALGAAFVTINQTDDVQWNGNGQVLRWNVAAMEILTNTTITLEGGDVTIAKGSSGQEFILEAELFIKGKTKIELHSTQEQVDASGLIDVTNIESSFIHIDDDNAGQMRLRGMVGGEVGQILHIGVPLNSSTLSHMWIEHQASGIGPQFYLASAHDIVLQKGIYVIVRWDGNDWVQIGGYTETNTGKNFFGTLFSSNWDNLFESGTYIQQDGTKMTNGSPSYDAKTGNFNQTMTEVKGTQNASVLGTIQIQYDTPWETGGGPVI